MITAPEAAASITSDCVMPPTPVCRTRSGTSAWESFAIWSWIASSEPATSAFSTRLSVDGLALLHRSKTSSRLTGAAAAGQRLGLEPDRALAGEAARLAVVADHAHGLTGVGDAVEAEDLDRLAGRRPRLTRWPMKSCIARTRPQWAPATSASPVLERAALHEDGHDRPAARVQPRLDHGAARGSVRVGLQLLDLGDQQDHVEQVVEALAWSWPRRRRRSCRRPSPRA